MEFPYFSSSFPLWSRRHEANGNLYGESGSHNKRKFGQINARRFPLGSPQSEATTGSYKRLLVAFSGALRRDKLDGSESWHLSGSAPNLLRNLGSRPSFAFCDSGDSLLLQLQLQLQQPGLVASSTTKTGTRPLRYSIDMVSIICTCHLSVQDGNTQVCIIVNGCYRIAT